MMSAVGDVSALILAVVAAGIITGLLAGLFGIGGGAVSVPALYEVFRILEVPEQIRMQLCIGTSLAIIVPTTIRSYVTHRAAGAVIPNVARIWAPAAVVGVIVGSFVAALASAAFFKIAFVLFAAFVAAKMLFGSSWRIGTQLPGVPLQCGFGFLTGLVSSVIGVGGGSVSNAVLTLYGKSIHQAVATSAGIAVPITIVGTIGYALAGWKHMPELPPLSLGFVSLIGVLLMAPISSISAPYGARLAHRLSKRQLEMAFGSFLLLVSTRFMLSLF
jgi:uncharacterized protein